MQYGIAPQKFIYPKRGLRCCGRPLSSQHPLTCNTPNASLDTILEENLVDVADRISRYRQGHRIGRMLLENGLIVSIRRQGSVLRFVPPFTTTEEQMDLAAEILDAAIGAVT